MHGSPYTLQWAAPFPSELPLPVSRGVSGPHLMHCMVSRAHPQSKRHLDRFSRFCRTHDRDRQADRLTDRPRYFVCNNRPHLCTVLPCGLIISVTVCQLLELYIHCRRCWFIRYPRSYRNMLCFYYSVAMKCIEI